MNETGMGGGWMFVLVILIVLFGFGGGLGFGGGNAAMAGFATAADVQNSISAAINAQNVTNGLGQIALSSANNNYETSQLINAQSMNMLNQNNTNLLAAINGFNAVNQNITNGFNSVNQNIADMGYKMDQCCCSIKTMLLENRLADANAALVTANTTNAINAQSQFLLSQLGTYTPAVV